MVSAVAKGKQKAIPTTNYDQKDVSGASSSSSGQSTSGASSDSESSDSDTDSEFGAVTEEYLESLLQKAKQNVTAKAKVKSSLGFTEEEEIRFPEQEDSNSSEFPSLDPGELPQSYFEFTDRRSGPSTIHDPDAEQLRKTTDTVIVPEQPPPPELAKDGRKLTKRELKEKRQKSAKPGYFDLPKHDPADLPRLHREVEALRLRNSLDPKRFYRKEEGEGKGIKGLPKEFAIGTIVPSSTPFGTASGENLTRSERKRTIVDELVDDSEAKRYAKRKFNELQAVRTAKGRGTLAKKKLARKPKW